MITTQCFQDLTRKTKIKGLSTASWAAVVTCTFVTWFFFLLWAIPVAVILYGLFALLEFLDEDFYQILILKNKVSGNKFYP